MENWDEVDNTLPLFSLEGHNKQAKCTDVYDGDTVKLVFRFGMGLYRWNCRIAGIDTPEIRGSSDNEKKLAYEAKQKVVDMILNKVVYVSCGKFDKYGRLLVGISTLEGEEVSEELIKYGLAHEYDGGTKKKWD